MSSDHINMRMGMGHTVQFITSLLLLLDGFACFYSDI